MVQAAADGDQQALADCFEFSDQANKRAAMVLLEQVAVEHQFYGALVIRFGNGAAGEVGTQNAADMTALRKDASAAPEKIDGDRAQITLSSGKAYFFIRGPGGWRIDFDKTQAQFGQLPAGEQLDVIRRQTAALSELSRDLRNNTVASFEDAAKRLSDIDDMVPGSVIRPPLSDSAVPRAQAEPGPT